MDRRCAGNATGSPVGANRSRSRGTGLPPIGRGPQRRLARRGEFAGPCSRERGSRVKVQTPRRPTPRNRPRGEDAARRERTAKALDLRIAGASYRQIARQLDVADATAYADVQDELGRLDGVNHEKAERLRDLEARRLDTLTLSLAPGIKAGDPRAVLAAVRILERRARLFGLDAAQPLTVAGTLTIRWQDA